MKKYETGKSALVGILWAVAVKYAEYLPDELAWQVWAIWEPQNLESFVKEVWIWIGAGGGGAAWWRSRNPIDKGFDVQPVDSVKETESKLVATLKRKGAAVVPKNWFTDIELDCKCLDLDGCDYQGMDPQVLRMANRLREHFGPISVNSAYRCPAHNKAVGGTANSYHVKGKAMDVRCAKATPAEMYAWLNQKYPRQYGLGLYKTFLHLDSRSDSWARKAGPEKPWRSFEHVSADIELASI